MIITLGQTVNYIPQTHKALIKETIFMPDNLPSLSEDSLFTFQGGTLVISPASWAGLISSSAMAAPHSLSIDPGTGGQLIIDYAGLDSTTLQTNLSLDLHLISPPPPGFQLQFAFSTATQAPTKTIARQRYDVSANQTLIQINEDFSFHSTAHTNIFIPGNPYQIPQDGRWYPLNVPTAGQSAQQNNAPVICYLAGTLIDTPQGPRPIEDFRPGDAVHVFKNKQKTVEYLRWTGQKSVISTSPDDWPIRIRRHAFGENCPFQDLYITEEHCLLLRGFFVPARMLINGRTILREKRDRYDIYHIETYEHRIISANGALSETYLDTGNRHSFTTTGKKIAIPSRAALHSPVKSWLHDAAAPLKVQQDFVEPLHAALAERATQLGFPAEEVPHTLTSDPDLTLFDPRGTELSLYQRTNGLYLFRLKGDPPFLIIKSRTARPDKAVGPFVDDRRVLGVLIGEITLVQPDGTDLPLTSHLTAPEGTGWDVIEATHCRWTNGEARLPLPDVEKQDGCLLKIKILSAGPYILS